MNDAVKIGLVAAAGVVLGLIVWNALKRRRHSAVAVGSTGAALPATAADAAAAAAAPPPATGTLSNAPPAFGG